MNRWHPRLLLLLLTSAAYVGVYHAGFVWDDLGLVVDNRVTGDLGNAGSFFAMDLWDGAHVPARSSGYYRPLVLLSFALDRALFDFWAPGHHLHSLAWHLLAVSLLFGLLRRLVPEQGMPWRSLAGAALFALHPLQLESVVWISARNDAMAAALGLAALGVVLDREASLSRLVVGATLACLAALAKESVVLLPLLLILLDIGRGGLGPWRRPLALAVGVLEVGALRAWAGVGVAAWPGSDGWALTGYRVPEILASTGLGLVWPRGSIDALEWLEMEAPQLTLGLVVLLGGPVVALFLAKQRRLVATGLVWALVAWVPSLLAVADKGLLGDRYLYFPLAGLALALTASLGAPVARVGLVLVIPALVWIHQRLPDWVNDLTFWQAAVRDNPTPYTRAGLGHSWNENGRPDRALALFVEALEGEPPYLDICPQVVGASLRMGQPDKAVELGEWALDRGCPRTGTFMARLAVAQAFTGDWAAARASLEEAPEDPQGRDLVVWAALHRIEGDEDAYNSIVRAWDGERSMEEQVHKLLVGGGHPEVAP